VPCTEEIFPFMNLTGCGSVGILVVMQEYNIKMKLEEIAYATVA